MKWQMIEKMQAEFFGTYWFVLGGSVGTMLLTFLVHDQISGMLEGLIYAFMYFIILQTIGRISGGHLIPSITIGLCMAGMFHKKHILPYLISQTLGGVFGIETYYLLRLTFPVLSITGLGENGYGAHSSVDFGVFTVFLIELLLSYLFVSIIIYIGKRKHTSRSVWAGLSFAILYGITRNITNGSMNPVKSTGLALFGDEWAMKQLWLFWVAPVFGAMIAGWTCRFVLRDRSSGLGNFNEFVKRLKEPFKFIDLNKNHQ